MLSAPVPSAPVPTSPGSCGSAASSSTRFLFFFFFVHGSPPVKAKPVSIQQAWLKLHKQPPAQHNTNLSGAASRPLASTVASHPLTWLRRTCATQAPDSHTRHNTLPRTLADVLSDYRTATQPNSPAPGAASSFMDPPHVHELGCLSGGKVCTALALQGFCTRLPPRFLSYEANKACFVLCALDLTQAYFSPP